MTKELEQKRDEVKSKVTIPMYFYQIIVPQLGDYYSVYPVDFESDPRVCCPLHDEQTPSFRYYESTGSFNCFGCQRGGDIIQLHRLYTEKMNGTKPTFEEAVRFLYNYFLKGRDLQPFKSESLSNNEKLNADSDVVKLNIYRVNLESSITYDESISLEAKKKIWSTLDDVDVLISKGLIRTSDAMKCIKDTVKEALESDRAPKILYKAGGV